MSSTPFDINQMLTKVEYAELERKQNKKFANAIDRLANVQDYVLIILVDQSIKHPETQIPRLEGPQIDSF